MKDFGKKIYKLKKQITQQESERITNKKTS